LPKLVGLRRFLVRFCGRADHAGTTPMAMRRDAAFAMFEFAASLAEPLRAAGGPDSVWNFGIVTVRPGAANVVPAEADLTVEFRDTSLDVIHRMEATFQGAVSAADGKHNVAVTSEPNGTLAPAAMDAELIDDLVAAAAEAGASHIKMPSGAGHDAMIFAPRIPSAMLFVPSIDGRSHDISENTSEDDIRRGFRVFATAVSKTLERLARSGSRTLHSRRQKEPAS
jgi:N-carbamoyl-L-amino-acid hydrolase